MERTTADALAACGLDAGLAARLSAAADAHEDPALEVLGASDATASALLRAAVVAAQDSAILSAALPVLLAALAPRLSPLPAFDRGVARHLEGLAAWRVARDVPAATRALNASLALLEGAEAPPARAYAGRVHDTLGQMLQHAGLLSEARAEFERALEAKRRAGDADGAALTEGNLGRLCMALGDFEAAERHLARDLAHVEAARGADARLRGQLLTQIAVCRAEVGDAASAAAGLRESLALARAAADPVGEAFAALHLGRALLAADDVAGAAGQADAVRPSLPTLPAWVAHEIAALATELDALVARRRGDLRGALDAFARAERHFDAAPRVSPVEHASFLEAYASACEAAGLAREASALLRRGLRRLDATTAEAPRARLEARLQALDETAWMLHGSGRFVGHEQIERLLGDAGRAGARGRAEEVTVLFSDLRGFTTFAERLDPEALVEVLNRYLAAMTRAIEHYGGYVDKFIGDAVMAVFSLPRPREDDADRALSAALYMRAELERFNRALPPGVPALESGTGLHHGGVVAGLIGSPQKRSYTVIGDAVNTASRLEGITKLLGVPVLLTREVRGRLARPDRWILLPFGRLRPKGRRGAVEAFGLVGEDDGGPEARLARARGAEGAAALADLAAGRFAAARRALAGLATAPGPGDRGYAWLAARAAEQEIAGDPDWDGALALTEK